VDQQHALVVTVRTEPGDGLVLETESTSRQLAIRKPQSGQPYYILISVNPNGPDASLYLPGNSGSSGADLCLNPWYDEGSNGLLRPKFYTSTDLQARAGGVDSASNSVWFHEDPNESDKVSNWKADLYLEYID